MGRHDYEIDPIEREVRLRNAAIATKEFQFENQAVVRWGVATSKLAESDPPVLVASQGGTGWVEEDEALSQFLLHMAPYQCVMREPPAPFESELRSGLVLHEFWSDYSPLLPERSTEGASPRGLVLSGTQAAGEGTRSIGARPHSVAAALEAQ